MFVRIPKGFFSLHVRTTHDKVLSYLDNETKYPSVNTEMPFLNPFGFLPTSAVAWELSQKNASFFLFFSYLY